MTDDHTDFDLNDDDDDSYIEQEEPLIAFERLHNKEEVPEGFSAATVLLDAHPSSSLKWDKALESAEDLIQRGIHVLFDFDVKLAKPFSHSGQFQTYALALTHFRETVWPKFKKQSAGVILCRSSLAFDKYFLWGQQEMNTLAERALPSDLQPLFYRDIMVEYFTLLASNLPDDCPVVLLFDCQEIKEPWLFSLLTSQDSFARFRLGLASAPFATNAICWKDSSATGDYIGRAHNPTEPTATTVGVLLPISGQLEKVQPSRIKKTIDSLLAQHIPFKIISEEFLTMEWEGLDTIILCHDKPSLPLQRALDGFIAASGNVIFDEASLENWLKK